MEVDSEASDGNNEYKPASGGDILSDHDGDDKPKTVAAPKKKLKKSSRGDLRAAVQSVVLPDIDRAVGKGTTSEKRKASLSVTEDSKG